MLEPKDGYPKGRNISYECLICKDLIPSSPNDGIGCKCGNIFIDLDAGRISIKNHEKAEIVKTNNTIFSKLLSWLK